LWPDPPPLLVQARLRLEEARQAERAAFKAWDLNRSDAALNGQVRGTQLETRRAQQWVDQVERSAAALPVALAEARKTLLMEESAYATMRVAHLRTETQQAQRVRQAEAQVAQVLADWRQVVGEAAP
jgi:hypothetical protein